MAKIFCSLLVGFFLTSGTASAGTIAQLGAESISGIVSFFKAKGFSTSASKEMATSLKESAKNLGSAQTVPSDVSALLQRDVATLGNESGDVFTKIFKAAESLNPNNHYILCRTCVASELTDAAVSAVLKKVRKNGPIREFLDQMPAKFVDIKKSIRLDAKALGLTKLAKNTNSYFAIADFNNRSRLRGYYVALKRMRGGSTSDIAFGKQIIKFGKKSLKGNNLWLMLSNPASTKDDIKMWTLVLKKINGEGGSPSQKKSALKKLLKTKGNESSDAKEAFAFMKKNNCWKLW